MYKIVPEFQKTIRCLEMPTVSINSPRDFQVGGRKPSPWWAFPLAISSVHIFLPL